MQLQSILPVPPVVFRGLLRGEVGHLRLGGVDEKIREHGWGGVERRYRLGEDRMMLRFVFGELRFILRGSRLEVVEILFVHGII